MRRHGVMIAMFGPPLAHEHGPGRDEDHLDREAIGEGHEPDSLDEIYERLRSGDEATVHFAMNLARILQEMAHAASRGDERGLEHWHQQGRQLLDHEASDDDE